MYRSIIHRIKNVVHNHGSPLFVAFYIVLLVGKVVINIESHIADIGEYTFYKYPTLRTVNINSDSLTIVGKHAFEGCKYLNRVKFSKNKLTDIRDYAFNGCSSISSITLPASVSLIGEEAFGGISSSMKAYCIWGSYSWDIMETKGFNVAEKTYKVVSEISTVEMDHIIGYLVDKSTSGVRNLQLQYICSMVADSAYYKSLVRSNFEQMGFDHYTSGNYSYPDGDHAGYMIGYMDTCIGERIVLVAIRGTHGELLDMGPDWRSNLFNVGPDNEHRHAGFNTEAREIYARLQGYVDVTAGNVRIVITGHSRGAAVGNILAADLISKAGIDPAHVIAYNFGCPNTVTHNQHTAISCPNVFNIINTKDLVPMVPVDDFEMSLLSPAAIIALL